MEENQKQLSQEDQPGASSSSQGYSRYLNRNRLSRRKKRGATGYAKGAGKQLAKKGEKKAATTLASTLAANWEIVAVAIGVILFLLLLLWVIISIRSSCENFWDDPIGNAPFAAIGIYTGICDPLFEIEGLPTDPPGITTEKEGPSDTGNNESIEYTIKVTFDPTAPNASIDDLYLFDVPLFKYEFISAIGNPETLTDTAGDNYLRWKLSDFINPEDDDTVSSVILLLTVRPTADDFIAVNSAYVAEEYSPIELTYTYDLDTGASSTIDCDPKDPDDLMCGVNSLPTDDNCGGKYTDRLEEIGEFLKSVDDRDPKTSPNPYTKMTGTGYNFADPVCSYTPAKWKALLHETEKVQRKWEFWEDIAKCESGILGIGEKDIRSVIYPKDGRTYNFPFGPWGHFQTGRGRPPIAKRVNWDDEDRGDVTWQQQILNAIKLNNSDAADGRNYQYWGTAYCFCAFPYYSRVNAWCGDIKANGWVRYNCNNSCVTNTANSKP